MKNIRWFDKKRNRFMSNQNFYLNEKDWHKIGKICGWKTKSRA